MHQPGIILPELELYETGNKYMKQGRNVKAFRLNHNELVKAKLKNLYCIYYREY